MVRVTVTVILRVYVMILFCTGIALFPVFYAFRICISHSAIPPYTHTLEFGTAARDKQLCHSLVNGKVVYHTGAS